MGPVLRQVQRRPTRKGVDLRNRKSLNHPLDSCIHAQTRRGQGATRIQHVRDVNVPRPGKEAPDPALGARISADDRSRRRVEAVAALARAAHGIKVDVVSHSEDRRKRVGKLDDGDGGDNGHEAKVVRDGGGNDEGNGPPDGNDDDPKNLAHPRRKRRRAQKVHEHIIIEDLDADVAVQARGNQTTQYGEHVADRLPGVNGHALVGDRVGVLALEVVDVAAVDEIDAVDEELRGPHGLDEVARAAHLGHELDEELRAAVGEDALEKAVERADQAARVRQAAVMPDGRVGACRRIRRDGRRIDCTARGAQLGDRVVGL